jgi:uncharacterized protein YbaR (Trm112 family)
MTDELIGSLRCPIDPARTAELDRDQQSLVCRCCRTRFPIRLGIPVLLADEAELPPDTSSPDALPCRRSKRPR